VFNRVKVGAPFLVRPIAKAIANNVDKLFITPNLDKHVAFLDRALATSTWLTGEELSLADIQMSYPLEALATRVPNAPKRIKAWVELAKARPAYQRAEAKGGPAMGVDD
jgi:glutathione S-transferase